MLIASGQLLALSRLRRVSTCMYTNIKLLNLVRPVGMIVGFLAHVRKLLQTLDRDTAVMEVLKLVRIQSLMVMPLEIELSLSSRFSKWRYAGPPGFPIGALTRI